MIKVTYRLLSLFLISLFILISCANTTKYDYVIKNGRIVDGMGNPWFKTDIGIKADKIVKIGLIPESHKTTNIDASGKIVTPGFIDIHSHADSRILDDPTAHNMIAQGTTTVIGGNCGGSRLNLEEFFQQIETKGTAVNIGSFVGHGSVRRKVMGNAGREPTTDELETMKNIVEHEMKNGALGLSTGLKYQPGVFSKTNEIISIAKVASRFGGIYVSHLRDEGLKLFESINEAIEIGKKAAIPVEVSHHKAAGAEMWGKTKISLAMMEDARQRGIDVTTDLHPYPATFTGLPILFPAWALEGNKSEILKRLSDKNIRKKVIDGIVFNIQKDRGGNDIRNITIAVCKHDKSIEGKNLKEILEVRSIEPTMQNAAELVIQIYENGNASAVYHCLSMEDVVRILQHPLAIHSSDAGIAEYKKGKPHPRHYGHFPRILAKHVREDGDLELEEAINKMTSMPAWRVGLRDRGIISEGKYADIVIFDPDKIQDKATFQNPHQYPEGIEYVFVNGIITINKGTITGELPGKVILGPGKTH
ncbi:amidohydrolase family protein [candidate division KSB1 bacterium]